MRAISFFLYDMAARRSSPDSRLSLEETIRRFCESNRHTIHQTFAFATAGINHTEATNSVLSFLEQQSEQFLVVVTDPCHLGATPQDAVKAVLQIDAQGSRVVSAIEGRRDPVQELYRVLTFATGDAASSRAQHIREAMLQKAVRGEGLGKTPYGYRVGESGKLEEVPEEAEVVRLIFRLYVEKRLGLRNIVRELNNNGHQTRRGANWSMVTIRDMLRNSAYIGTYRRFGLRIPSSHTPIIDRESYRKVQDIMESHPPRRRNARHQPFLLSGLAVCAECGNSMIGVTRRQAWRNKDGQRMRSVYRYYQCQSRANQSICQYHSWRASTLEEAVAEALRSQLRENPRLANNVLPQNQADADRGSLNASEKRRYMAYLKQAADGAIPLRRLRVMLEELNAKRGYSGWADAANESESPFDPHIIKDASAWQDLESATKRRTLLHWIRKVEVSDKDVRLTIRSGEKGEAITPIAP